MAEIGDIIQVSFNVTQNKLPKEGDIINIRYNNGKVKGDIITVLILEGQANLSIRITEIFED